jgi:hypothetical protein
MPTKIKKNQSNPLPKSINVKQAKTIKLPYPSANFRFGKFNNINLFNVLSPDPTDPNSPYEWTYAGDNLPVQISITFSNPVDRTTLIVGKNFILRAAGDLNAKGTVDWSDDSTMLTFTSEKNGSELLVPNPDIYFAVLLFGTAIIPTRQVPFFRPAIINADGIRLDGNYSGSFAGGNYTTFFTLIG